MPSIYPLERITWQKFEDLTIKICQEVLGIGAKTFSNGVDGGRDSRFEGTAAKYPSVKDSWKGVFIIQAKHTATVNASCSDNDFGSLSSSSSIIVKELKRLKKLLKNDPFQNYLLFTNRKLPANKHTELRNHLKNQLGINNVEIIGVEEINKFLDDFTNISVSLELYKFLYPLTFREKQIKDVILLFDNARNNITGAIGGILTDFSSIPKDKKNELNNLSKEYFDFIQTHSFSHFQKIDSFLKNPINKKLARDYENTVSDLQAKIILERNKYGAFEYLIEHLIDYVVDNNEPELADVRNMVRVFFHFMYFNCDIGKKHDTTT